MKKILIFLIASMLCATTIIGCGGTKKESTNVDSQNTTKVEKTNEEENSEQVEEKKEEIKTITDGQTISTDNFDLILNKVELTYDVLPDDTSGFYTHYPADSGKVYINVDVDIKNSQKQDLPCDQIMSIVADYNNGYTYNANPIVEDSQTGFTYANITSITPLESKGMRYLIDCPQEVEQSQNPLFLTFDLNGEKYKYTVR